MKTIINIEQWNRREQFLFFGRFQEPFFGVTVNVDCSEAYRFCKEKGQSFFLYYLYQALKAANEVEPFRYRIAGSEVYLYDKVNASPTINRPNGTFGFAYMDYEEDPELFFIKAKEVIKNVQQSEGLSPAISGENVIHFSAIPWLDFTSLSHARSFSFADSAPAISFGRMTDGGNKRTMPISIHVHHGLMDAYHVGLFVDKFQKLLAARRL